MLTKIKNWFSHSEVVLWARANIAMGVAALWMVLQGVDLSALLGPKSMTAWLIVNGFVTEMARRRNTVKTVTDNVGGVNVVTLQPAQPPLSDPPAGSNG